MKTVLVRINLDIKEKKISDTLRFRVASETIKSLSKKNNKVVLLSHRGRPTHPTKELSLRPFAGILSRELKKKIIFLKDLEDAKEKIAGAKGGTVFLIENLRFWSGERKNSLFFARKIASLGDSYINNDFATSHRKAASLVAITKFIPSKNGKVIKDEVRALTKVINRPKHPFVLVIGGAKIKDKAKTIKNLLKNADSILLGGGVANTFLKARGLNIRKSLYEPELVKKAKRFASNKKIKLPIDYREEKGKILDIGDETIKEYKKEIKDAKTIVWGGPMGKFEDRKFRRGNKEIAGAILSNKKAHIVIGGAQTVSSLPIIPKSQKRGNVFFSTGGGAMLQFLAGKKLPALEAVRKSKK